MNTTRLLILLIALGAGGAAFFMVSSNGPVQTPLPSIVPQAEGPKMVRVLVASEDIPQGAVVEHMLTSWVEWPENRVPEFYVTEDNAGFYEQLPQMRARRQIFANEPIMAANTVARGDGGMMAAILTPGMQAVTARLNAEQSAGGFILPGDRVDIFATGVQPGDTTGAATAWVLMSNVRVVAIDQAAAVDPETNAVVGRTVTLEMTPQQVRTFIEMRDSQSLTLSLRSIFDADLQDTVDQTTPDEVVVIRYGSG